MILLQINRKLEGLTLIHELINM